MAAQKASKRKMGILSISMPCISETMRHIKKPLKIKSSACPLSAQCNFQNVNIRSNEGAMAANVFFTIHGYDGKLYPNMENRNSHIICFAT